LHLNTSKKIYQVLLTLIKNVPQALENVSIKATAKDVRYRYADINEMLRDIGTALSLDRRGEQKVIFDKDKNITQVMQKQLIDPHDTKNLIKPVFADEAEPKNETNQPKKKKRRGLIATLIILGLLLVGFLAYLIVSPSNVKMPNVTGMTLTQAEAKIKDAHLKVGKIDYEQNSTVATNNVISTDPQQNSTTKEGTSINIVVSQGANPIKMPDYVGQMYKDAVDDLIVNQNVSNNQITKKDVQSSQPAGTILNQTPGKGQYFDLNGSAQIVFEVSTGPADSQVTMPTYTSGTNSIMKLADLKNQLINLGVPESNITVIYQQTQVQQADGYVANVNPQQGTQFDPRTTQIVISVYQYQASESSPAANTNNSSTSSSPASTTPPSSS
jgi:serine/threonine-protein kinase